MPTSQEIAATVGTPGWNPNAYIAALVSEESQRRQTTAAQVISPERDAILESQKHDRAFHSGILRDDRDIALSPAAAAINRQYQQQHGSVVGSAETYQQGSFQQYDPSGDVGYSGNAAKYKENWQPLQQSKYAEEIANQPSQSMVPMRDLSSGMQTTYFGEGSGTEGRTFYAAVGEQAQVPVEKSKIVYDETGGSFNLYERPASIYENSGFTRKYGITTSGGGVAALQSGMFSVDKPLTPVVYDRASGGSKYAAGVDVDAANAVVNTPALFSRMGAEAYGGLVSLLDNRTLPANAQMGRYEPSTGNLANLVNPTGVNQPKENFATTPWKIADFTGSPTFQTVNVKGELAPTSAKDLGSVGIYSSNPTGIKSTELIVDKEYVPFGGMTAVTKAEQPSQVSASMDAAGYFGGGLGFGVQAADAGVNGVRYRDGSEVGAPEQKLPNPFRAPSDTTVTSRPSEDWVQGVPLIGGVLSGANSLVKEKFGVDVIPKTSQVPFGLATGFAPIETTTTRDVGEKIVDRSSIKQGGAEWTAKFIGADNKSTSELDVPIKTTYSKDANLNVIATTEYSHFDLSKVVLSQQDTTTVVGASPYQQRYDSALTSFQSRLPSKEVGERGMQIASIANPFMTGQTVASLVTEKFNPRGTEQTQMVESLTGMRGQYSQFYDNPLMSAGSLAVGATMGVATRGVVTVGTLARIPLADTAIAHGGKYRSALQASDFASDVVSKGAPYLFGGLYAADIGARSVDGGVSYKSVGTAKGILTQEGVPMGVGAIFGYGGFSAFKSTTANTPKEVSPVREGFESQMTPRAKALTGKLAEGEINTQQFDYFMRYTKEKPTTSGMSKPDTTPRAQNIVMEQIGVGDRYVATKSPLGKNTPMVMEEFYPAELTRPMNIGDSFPSMRPIGKEEALAYIKQRYPQQESIFDKYLTDTQMIGRRGQQKPVFESRLGRTTVSKSTTTSTTDYMGGYSKFSGMGSGDVGGWSGGGGSGGGGGGAVSRVRGIPTPKTTTVTSTKTITQPISRAREAYKFEGRAATAGEAITKVKARVKAQSKPAEYSIADYDSSVSTGTETAYGNMAEVMAAPSTRQRAGFSAEARGISTSASRESARAETTPSGVSMSREFSRARAMSIPSFESTAISESRSRTMSIGKASVLSEAIAYSKAGTKGVARTESQPRQDILGRVEPSSYLYARVSPASVITSKYTSVPVSRTTSTSTSAITSIVPEAKIITRQTPYIPPPVIDPIVTPKVPKPPIIPPLGGLWGGGSSSGDSGRRGGRGAYREVIGIRSSLISFFGGRRRR